jgi:hypothetical protein
MCRSEVNSDRCLPTVPDAELQPTRQWRRGRRNRSCRACGKTRWDAADYLRPDAWPILDRDRSDSLCDSQSAIRSTTPKGETQDCQGPDWGNVARRAESGGNSDL